jgi:hypothetical protein
LGPPVPQLVIVEDDAEMAAAIHSGAEFGLRGSYDSDARYHFRMATDSLILFNHVIYGRVPGGADRGCRRRSE